MRVAGLYTELDVFVKTEVVKYLQHSGIHLGTRIRGKQMRFLGVPSLTAMMAHEEKTKAVDL
jgi:hypothetical protein